MALHIHNPPLRPSFSTRWKTNSQSKLPLLLFPLLTCVSLIPLLLYITEHSCFVPSSDSPSSPGLPPSALLLSAAPGSASGGLLPALGCRRSAGCSCHHHNGCGCCYFCCYACWCWCWCWHFSPISSHRSTACQCATLLFVLYTSFSLPLPHRALCLTPVSAVSPRREGIPCCGGGSLRHLLLGEAGRRGAHRRSVEAPLCTVASAIGYKGRTLPEAYPKV